MYIIAPWISTVKSILDHCGLGYIWQNQDPGDIKSLALLLKRRLSDQFIQTWSGGVYSSGACLNYRLFKKTFGYEKYLNILPDNAKYLFCKFRTGNHKLAIVKGRHQNVPKNERICNICKQNVLGDEYHFIFECVKLVELRNICLPKHFRIKPNQIKFKQLFETEELKLLLNIVKLIRNGMIIK